VAKFGEAVATYVDLPLESKEEAQAIADGRMRAAMMNYITGEGLCRGTPEIKLGVVVEIVVNPDGKDRFNGKYVITGTSHQYRGSQGGGYLTGFKFRRDADS
jgi:phage protein D